MPAAQHDTHTSQATLGRILGLLVFLGGIALLVSVFVTARALFNAPAPTIVPAVPPAPTGDAGTTASATAGIGNALGQLVRQIFLLLLMCIAGSVIASKGIQMFFAAHALPGGRDADTPRAEPAPRIEPAQPKPSTPPASPKTNTPPAPSTPATPERAPIEPGS